ncbi:hypothetical protein [Pseudomonas sp. 25 R 14]|nr:hypothetical protein [Pseudomonas sp. 25 R 14]
MRTLVAEVERQGLPHTDHHGQRVVGPLEITDVLEHQLLGRFLLQHLGHRVVLEHQQAVEQVTAVLRGPALDVEQRRVFVLTQAQVQLLHTVQPAFQALFRLWAGNHRQRIDEQADLLFDALEVGRPPGHSSPERHARLTGITLQQQQPGRLDQGVEGDFVSLGQAAQTLGGRFVHNLALFAIERLRTGDWCVCDSTGQMGRLIERQQLLFPESLAGLGILALQPLDVVTIAAGIQRQRFTAVALQHLPHQLRSAPAIHEDVMVGVDQVITQCIDAYQHQTQ